ncbi:hypothetical protein TNCV_267871 [Trichonephila clavipes]|nr:hypothetical protein TNCV_267871 [Trichonephila clavipes]
MVDILPSSYTCGPMADCFAKAAIKLLKAQTSVGIANHSTLPESRASVLPPPLGGKEPNNHLQQGKST